MIRFAATEQVPVPPRMVNAARPKSPKLYFDAMIATQAEIDSRIKSAAREAARASVAAETDRLLAGLRKKYGSQ
jgi:hypothetical protein